MRVTPENAAVYIDGFYAGIVEDFDGVFEGIKKEDVGGQLQTGDVTSRR